MSVTYETNGSNNKYNEFGSEPIFKKENYITSSKGGEYNKVNTVSQRERKKNQNKIQRKILLTLDDLIWRTKRQLMTKIINQKSLIKIACS